MKQNTINSILILMIILICSLIGVLAWTNPIVTLESPASGTYSNTTNVVFNFSFSALTINSTQTEVWANATLFLNGVRNVSIGNGTGVFTNDTEYSNLTVSSIEDGIFIWNVQIENGTSDVMWWAPNNFTLTIDNRAPLVGGLSPAVSVFTQNDSLTVTAECNDTNPNLMKLWVNGVVNDSYLYTNATPYTFEGISNFNNGDNVSWYVSCTDDADNEGWSAYNGSNHMDLTDITLASNISNGTWSTSSTVYMNISYTENKWPDSCELWGNFNKTSEGDLGDWGLNATIFNKTGALNVSITPINLSLLILNNTNDTNKFFWNVWCNSSGGKTAWLSPSYNLTLGVDYVAPTTPDLRYISTEYYTNTTGTVRRWRNMTNFLTVTDATPTVVFYEIDDVNDVTVTIAFDNDSGMASPEYMFTVSGTNITGTMTIANNTKVSLSPGRPYTTWYYTINVTDEAGNVNWSGSNKSTKTYAYEYRVSAYGASLTENVWNPIGIARTNINTTLHQIMNETSASYITVYNTTHDFTTCSATNNATAACLNTTVNEGNPIWIYVDANKSWDYSWWNSSTTKIPDLSVNSHLGYGAGPGVVNITNNSNSNWNYFTIMNWSDGCTYENLQVILNSTANITSLTKGTKGNVNETGLGNVTFMSFFNYTQPEYYPYYFGFGSPWNETKMEFRDVVAVFKNNTASPAGHLNRSGC